MVKSGDLRKGYSWYRIVYIMMLIPVYFEEIGRARRMKMKRRENERVELKIKEEE